MVQLPGLAPVSERRCSAPRIARRQANTPVFYFAFEYFSRRELTETTLLKKTIVNNKLAIRRGAIDNHFGARVFGRCIHRMFSIGRGHGPFID